MTVRAGDQGMEFPLVSGSGREARSSLQLQNMSGQTFKFCGWPEPLNQSMAQQPGGCSVNAVFAADHLGFRYAFFSASVSERSVQSREFNGRLRCVLVYHRWIA